MGAYSVNTCNRDGELYVSLLNKTDKAIVLEKDKLVGLACNDYSIQTNSCSVECKTVNCELATSSEQP
jgi:hypothetical protein